MALVLALRANSAHLDSAVEERRVRRFSVVSITIAILCVGIYYPLAPYLVPLIAPNSHAAVKDIVDQLMPFLPAVFGFYAMRNFVDIRFHFPFNLCTLVVSMLALLAVVWLRGDNTLQTVVLGSMAMFGVLYVYVALVTIATYWPRRA